MIQLIAFIVNINSALLTISAIPPAVFITTIKFYKKQIKPQMKQCLKMNLKRFIYNDFYQTAKF